MSKIARTISVLVSLVLLVGGAWVILNRQLVLDQLRVWRYQPSSEISALANNIGLSEHGRFQFYAAWPRLESSTEFNTECRRAEKASPILGCYKQDDDTIHIYNVTDAELDGIKEVTAAHEMLHAAYARLSEADRQRLGELLETAYARLKDDKLEERMAYYDRAQPGSRANELHSILGTEFADLGDELEAHYRKYFADRSKVLALHASYNQKFVALEQQAAELTASLARQKTAIDGQKVSYDIDLRNLNQKISEFNQRAANGDFDSQEQFNSERAALQAKGRELERRRAAILQLINIYNADVEKLNALGEQAERLNQSLDSQKAVE